MARKSPKPAVRRELKQQISAAKARRPKAPAGPKLVAVKDLVARQAENDARFRMLFAKPPKKAKAVSA